MKAHTKSGWHCPKLLSPVGGDDKRVVRLFLCGHEHTTRSSVWMDWCRRQQRTVPSKMTRASDHGAGRRMPWLREP